MYAKEIATVSPRNDIPDQVSCVMHIHSTFSDEGKVSLETIVTRAKERGIKVVIPTDHDLTRGEYGLWPFRKILRRVVEKNSVFQIGVERYLSEIERLQKKYPEMVIIPGVESTPFYWWSGSPFKRNLVSHNWHKHILIIGLDRPEQYYKLPILGNETKAGKFKLILFWPFILIFTGLIVRKISRKVGLTMILVSIVFLAYSFPFKTLPFDQYHGDQLEKPYQNLIDYVNTAGGLTFWAHPEAPNWKKPVSFGKVSIQTSPYPQSIIDTHDYTGFAYFWEGNEIVGKAGGLWDKTLIEYCQGGRKNPVWAVGELDYTEDGINNIWLYSVQNVLLIDGQLQDKSPINRQLPNRKAVMEALSSGRFYVIYKAKPDDYEIVLKKFGFTGKSNKVEQSIRPLAESKNIQPLQISVATSDNLSHLLKIKLISEGQIIKVSKQSSPVNIIVQVPQKGYYRLEIKADNGGKLVTNPIFSMN